MQLTTAGLQLHIGGQIEIQNQQEEYLYRGDIKEAKVENNELHIILAWCAKGEGYPPFPNRWIKVNNIPEYAAGLQIYSVKDIGPGREGGSRILLESAITNEVVTLFPRDGSKLEISRVEEPELVPKSPLKLKIFSTPPGSAPEGIRKDWVGLEIPVPTQEEVDQHPPSGRGLGTENEGGFSVLREDAIAALIKNEKLDAASFWASLPLGRFLLFSRECSGLVSPDGPGYSQEELLEYARIAFGYQGKFDLEVIETLFDKAKLGRHPVLNDNKRYFIEIYA